LRWFLPAILLNGALVRAADTIEYNRDIRPILVENCFSCHGPDTATRKAHLRLDLRDKAVEAQAIVPGSPEKSALVQRIFATDAAEQMPPPRSHKSLTATQKNLLRAWIARGAAYQPHWSFLMPCRPSVPDVRDRSWPRNPIDHFILAELEKRGLKPAAEADRRTLARRVSLDLIGLPPRPEEVDAFVNDPAADAYERYVEGLLQSVHWGEHRARYWLDLARYADTYGFDGDAFCEASAYRDWVINAFNENQPFDQFTVEQLAGDLLPNATLAQKVATGFNRCTMVTGCTSVVREEYLALYTRDRTQTVAQVWLGLTANCAVCHDHKFDPLTMRDFYALSAFFNNTKQEPLHRNIPSMPPVVWAPPIKNRPLLEQLQALNKRLEEAPSQQAQASSTRSEVETWLAARGLASAMPESTDLQLHGPLNEGHGQTITLTVTGFPWSVTLEGPIHWGAGQAAPAAFTLPPKAIELPDVSDLDSVRPSLVFKWWNSLAAKLKGVASGLGLDTAWVPSLPVLAHQAISAGAWVLLPGPSRTGSVVARREQGGCGRGWDLWIEEDRVGMYLGGSGPDDAVTVVAAQRLPPGQWHHIFATSDGSGQAAGVQLYIDGACQEVDVRIDHLQSSIRNSAPLIIGQQHGQAALQGVGLRDLRVYTRALSAAEVTRLAAPPRIRELLAKPATERPAREMNELYDWWLSHRSVVKAQVKQELAAMAAPVRLAPVMEECNTEPMAYVLHRGQYNQRREPVRPATPSFLPPMPAEYPRNRLGFAQWLVRPEHPLTARVAVNRFWQEIFGQGIVPTCGDFGAQGEPPSHPELLDWLAVEFRESGWDVKRCFRLLVTSAAYRQSASTTAQKSAADPDNRLLSRGPRFRMDAEMIRDQALVASGLFVPDIGGPSVRPYLPEGIWQNLPDVAGDRYHAESGENLYRRSIYTLWKRSAPPAPLEIFDAPSRETCTVQRQRSNTPMQALVTLNDVQFIEAARRLAENAMLQGGDRDESRLDFIARRVLARPLRAEETKIVREIHDDLKRHFAACVDDARKLIVLGDSKADPTLDVSDLAAWTMVVNQFLNLDEAMSK
jgi:hypothetical protein